MRCSRSTRRHLRIPGSPPFGQSDGVFGELLVGGGGGNTNLVGVVSDLVREEWEHRKALIESLGGQPLVRRHGVSLREGELSQIPHRVVGHARSTCLEHDLGDLGDFEGFSFIPGMDLELSERDDGRGVQGPARRPLRQR